MIEKRFDTCKKIYLNWVFHTDNDLIFYQNFSLFKRFPKLEKEVELKHNYSQKVKTIIRGNISNFQLVNDSHATHIHYIM